MKIIGPTKDSQPGRQKPWRIQVSREGKKSRAFYATRQEGVDERKLIEKSMELGDFCERFPRHAKKLGLIVISNDKARWSQVVSHYLRDKLALNCRPATLNTWKHQLSLACRRMNDPVLSTLEPQEVIHHIEGYKTEMSRVSIRNALSTFFSWCGAKGFCEKDKFKGLTWSKIREDKQPISFLGVEEVKDLLCRLQLCQKNGEPDQVRTRKLQAAFACAVFAGVRPGSSVPGHTRYGELQCLKSDDIDFEKRQLRILSGHSKTREERIITELPPNLAEWLQAAEYEPGEYICPMNYTNWRKALKKARERVGMANWASDILRHTFGTYGFWRDLAWAIDAGGWKNTSTFFKHYKGRTTHDESDAFYQITPSSLSF
jgi:integrase